MNPIDVGGWNRFENRVLKLLQYPEEYVKQLENDFQAFVCVLRLWQYPTFAEYSSYLVFKSVRSPANSDCLLVVVRWNRPEDLRKFSSPTEGLKYRLGGSVEPLITFRHAWLETDSLLSSLKLLQCFKCEPFPDCESISLDGMISGIEVKLGNQKTSFSWINDGPSQWDELIDSVEKIHQQLNEILSDEKVGGN